MIARGSRWTLVCAFLALLGLFSPAARADYQDDYRKGIAALDVKKWSEAAASLRRAIAQRPEEGGPKVRLASGTFFEDYLPHFHLSRALQALGESEAARQSLAESQRQGVVTSTRYAKELTRLAGLLGPPAPVAKPTPEQRVAASATPSAATAPEPARPALPVVEAEDLGRLAQSRSALAAALRDLEGLQAESDGVEAGPRAELETRLRRDRDLAETLVRESAGVGPSSPAADARQLMERMTRAGASLEGLAADWRAAAEPVRRAAGAAIESEELAAASGAFTAAPESPQLASAPSGALTEAARLYFAGRYAEAAAKLEEAAKGAPFLEGKWCLLRSAAWFNLSRIQPEGQRRALTRARDAMAACAGGTEIGAAERRYFSPAFVRFVASGRAG